MNQHNVCSDANLKTAWNGAYGASPVGPIGVLKGGSRRYDLDPVAISQEGSMEEKKTTDLFCCSIQKERNCWQNKTSYS